MACGCTKAELNTCAACQYGTRSAPGYMTCGYWAGKGVEPTMVRGDVWRYVDGSVRTREASRCTEYQTRGETQSILTNAQ